MNAFVKSVLKGSLASVVALTMAAVGCSDTDKETTPGAGGDDATAGSKTDGGTSAKAGTGNGGYPGTEGGTAGAESGGAADGGATVSGGAGGAGGAAAGGAGGAGGIAVARFCNNLSFGTDEDPMDVTFILEVGAGADKVSFTAKTGKCAPIDGAACASIPLGTDVPVALFDADDTSAPLFEGVVDTDDGDNWIFYTDLSNDAEPSPIAKGAAVTDIACDDVTYANWFE